METNSLYQHRQECYGCSACASICPTGSIKMQVDDLGFQYPVINQDTCVNCGLCCKVCGKKIVSPQKKPIVAFAGVCSDREIRKKSTSGGIFAVLAEQIIQSDGIVFGAVMVKGNDDFQVKHIGVSDLSELPKLQGSKYMQSNLEGIFPQIKGFLSQSKKVLFCGTPCQIDALNHFLGREYDDLVTVDVLCHGVPSVKIYNDYIQYEKKKRNVEEFDVVFRDKEKNRWTHGAVLITKKNNRYKKKTIFYNLSPFYMSFMDGHILRESCYACQYASNERPADITLGDYWGIQKAHPEILKRNGGQLDQELGISCIVANSEKGLELIRQCGDKLILIESTCEKISKYNPAYVQAVSKPRDYNSYAEMYREKGFAGIDQLYREKYKVKIPIFIIKNAIPYELKMFIRKMLRGAQ